VITRQLQRFSFVSRALFQRFKKVVALVEFIPTETNHEIAVLDVMAGDQP
jgi:hypothetical protein